MHIDKNMQFIRSKILDTQIALFHCHTNSILRINNTVINTLAVNNDGCIWFFIARPQQLISQFDQEFPVGMKYFKKGNSYSLDILGKARIVTDPEELTGESALSPEQVATALCSQVLIKVKILQVNYLDHNRNVNGFMERAKTALFSWLAAARPAGKTYNFGAGNKVGYGF